MSCDLDLNINSCSLNELLDSPHLILVRCFFVFFNAFSPPISTLFYSRLCSCLLSIKMNESVQSVIFPETLCQSSQCTVQQHHLLVETLRARNNIFCDLPRPYVNDPPFEYFLHLEAIKVIWLLTTCFYFLYLSKHSAVNDLRAESLEMKQ